MRPSAKQAPSVKLEVLSFRSAEPAQPIRFEFGSNCDAFHVQVPTDPVDGTTKEQSWREWKQRAMESSLVRSFFKSSSVLFVSEFALRLPTGEWVAPDSERDAEIVDTDEILRLAGANRVGSAILLLYAPEILVCSFDGIKFSASTYGHWLSATDTKISDKLCKVPCEETPIGDHPNDLLLLPKHQADFASLLYRIAMFMKSDLGLHPDQYVMTIPFGESLRMDGCSRPNEVTARIQLVDTKVFLTLMTKFEDKLHDEDRSKRLDYFLHQRQSWLDARSFDYKRWARHEASCVEKALEAIDPQASSQQFKLPRNYMWDEYGRMQLCLKLVSPICDMAGQMGSISSKLKAVVNAVLNAAQQTGSKSLTLSCKSDQCFVLLPADVYMNVLARANANPRTWGEALLNALKDQPERLYSGLLCESYWFYAAPSKDDLIKIDDSLRSLAPRPLGFRGLPPLVDTSALPLSAEVIRALEGKNHTDKRLFLERQHLYDAKPQDSNDRVAVLAGKPSVWDMKRAEQAPVPPPEPLPQTAPPPIQQVHQQVSQHVVPEEPTPTLKDPVVRAVLQRPTRSSESKRDLAPGEQDASQVERGTKAPGIRASSGRRMEQQVSGKAPAEAARSESQSERGRGRSRGGKGKGHAPRSNRGKAKLVNEMT